MTPFRKPAVSNLPVSGLNCWMLLTLSLPMAPSMEKADEEAGVHGVPTQFVPVIRANEGQVSFGSSYSVSCRAYTIIPSPAVIGKFPVKLPAGLKDASCANLAPLLYLITFFILFSLPGIEFSKAAASGIWLLLVRALIKL